MIRNLVITYDNKESAWQLLQFRNPVLHAFSVGFLATVLAYQGIGIVMDLILGSKKRGEVNLADLSILLRTEDSSFDFKTLRFFLKAIWNCIWPSNPRGGKGETAENNGMKPITAAKLVFLLAVIPLINLMCIILTLETEATVSCKDARFGGIGLGIYKNLSFAKGSVVTVGCTLLDIELGVRDRSVMDFFQCWKLKGARGGNDSVASIHFGSSIQGILLVGLTTPKKRTTFHVHVNIRTTDQLYRLKPVLQVEEAVRLVKKGANELLGYCAIQDKKSNLERLLSLEVFESEDEFFVSQQVACGHIVHNDALSVVSDIRIALTVINWPTFEVAPVSAFTSTISNTEQPRFESGGKLPLFRRRRSYASVLSILVATFCVAVIKVIVKLICRNDIHLCLELMVKRYAGIYECDSMLQDQSTLRYGDARI